MSDTPTGTLIGRDDEYKEAIQSVVDDNMRTDVLGPGVCKVLSEHTPASKKIESMMAEIIATSPIVKTSIETVVTEIDTRRKSKLVDRTIGAVGGVVGGIALALLTAFFTGYLPKRPAVTTDQRPPAVESSTTTSPR